MTNDVSDAPRAIPAEKPWRDEEVITSHAMEEARAAQRAWGQRSVQDRTKFLRGLLPLLAEHSIRLAEAAGQGRKRPVAETMSAEVLPLAAAAKFLAKKAASILRPQKVGAWGRPIWLGRTETTIRRDAHGVILVIGPGNYPLFLAGVQILQALVAGNAVLMKPGVGGGHVASVLRELVIEAGLDPRLLIVLPESVEAARAAISAKPDKVVFTGSAEVGRSILMQLAFHLIPATMELSGSDAVIVRADADLKLAADAVAFGLALNGGATCMGPRRALVDERAGAKFEQFLCERLAQVEFPLEGPGAEAMRNSVVGAIGEGARVIHGRVRGDGSVFGPIVLGSVQGDAAILREEIFAPVLSIVATENDDEAIRRANESPFALGASVFTSDRFKAAEISGRLNAGTVSVNDLIVPTADPRLPFGGRKNSGFGVTRGVEGLLEMTAAKVITVTRGRFRPAFDPPKRGDERLFANLLKVMHSGSMAQSWRALRELGKGLMERSRKRRNLE